MPRRQFKADVADLCRRVSTGSLPNVWAVNCDDLDDNDEFVVVMRPRKRGHQTHVRVLCGDVDVYPNTNSYFLSIDSPHADATETAFLSSFQNTSHHRGSSRKRSVLCLVRDMSEMFATLRNPRSPSRYSEKNSSAHAIITDSNVNGGTDDSAYGDTENDTDDDADSDWDDDASAFDFNEPLGDTTWTNSGSGSRSRPSWPSPLLQREGLSQRIGRDLRAVIHQGYRFGIIQGMADAAEDHLLSVAVRVSALGLPRQTLLAWDLDPAVYLVLLIHMQDCYMPYETLAAHPSMMANVSFRIGKCQRYKPSLSAAKDAFDLLPTKATGPRTTALPADPGTFSKIMISNSLNTFMSNSFLSLSRIHNALECSWADALDVLRKQALDTAAPERVGRDGPDKRSPAGGTTKPTIIKHSFPLMAMQFAMDQVVNCTKYCQACHARTDKATESIKPTVCSDDLCLFQYMQMGMGRSTEHEILAQPAVVDLLVSFCYAALCPCTESRSRVTPKGASPKGSAIRTYPENIGLWVMGQGLNLGIYRCKRGRRPCILLRDRCLLSKFGVGDWVVIQPSGAVDSAMEYTQRPEVQFQLRHAIVTQVDAENATLYLSHGTFPYCDIKLENASVCRYDRPFEDVRHAWGKEQVLRLILDTLPPIAWIRMHLERHACTSLRDVPGVSPSAARLLEWILATNRSCILEIQCPELDFGSESAGQWAQFSFLHGSPDANARFQKARQKAAENRQHPTLLAWHGSPIRNWHSIVRTGLDYNVVANGRSFGDGVYFSPQFSTSHHYARAAKGAQWAHSQFDLQRVLSLNEVVNAPMKFHCVRPHYVVRQRDWHQCRVLLVENRKPYLATPHIIDNDGAPAKETVADMAASPAPVPLVASGWLQQDAQYTAYGPKEALRIPLDLLPATTNHRPGDDQDGGPDKIDLGAEEDAARADMDAEDLAFCLSSSDATGPQEQDTLATSGTAAQPRTPRSQLESVCPVDGIPVTTSSPTSSSSSVASASRSLLKAQRRAKQAQRKRASTENDLE